MMGGGNDSLMYPEFMAFVTDEANCAAVRAFAISRGWPEATVQLGGVELFSTMLEAAAPPRLVIVDLDGEADPIKACQRLINLCGPSIRIITVGSSNDVRLYRALTQAGAVDYIVKPLTPELLEQAIQQSQTPKAGPAQVATGQKSSKLIVAVGVHGGVGATTLVTNLAWTLSEELKHNTALIDLDLQFGACALALDIEPSRGMRELLNSPQRVDSLMIASTMMVAGKKLSVMSAEESVGEVMSVDPAALSAIIKDLRESFEFIVVDLPRHLTSALRPVLAEAQAIVLVSDQSLAGARDVLRLKTWIKGVKADLPVSIVTARHGKDRPAALDQSSFEKGIQGKVDFVLPEDTKIVNQTANTGKAFVAAEPGAAASKAVRDMARHFVGAKADAKNENSKKPGGLLSGIMGGGKK